MIPYDPTKHFRTIAAEAPPVFVALIDPCLCVLSGLVVMAVADSALRDRDIIALVLIALMTFPGTVPFRRWSCLIVAQVVMRHAIALMVLLTLGMVIGEFITPSPAYFEPARMLAWFITATVTVLVAHGLSARLMPQLRRQRRREAVVIVGVNAVGQRLAQVLDADEDHTLDQRVLGFFDDRSPGRTGLALRQKYLGTLSELAAFVQAYKVSVIYITLPMTPQPRVVSLLRDLQDTTATVCFAPDIYMADVIQGGVRLVGGVPTLAMCDTPLRGNGSAFKRALDLAVTLVALPLLMPLMALIALAIRLSSPGPVIFKQRRFGMGGEEIIVFKFRTMRVLEDGDRSYRQVTRDDDRVTPIGRLLRKTSLDELPQFLNVLDGSMSLVGPRPHALAVNEQFRRLIPGYMVRHKVKPGITGWAQVNGARGGDDIDAMRKRTEYDLQYLRTWSIVMDLLIVWKTAVMLVRGDKNAF